MINKYCTLLSFVLFAVICYGQQDSIGSQNSQQSQVEVQNPRNAAINVGVLMGGGGLIGADFELLIGKQIGLQLGTGIGISSVGFGIGRRVFGISSIGFGINFHLKPRINSQFVSIVYWHQGFADDHYASYFGPVYTFRARKIFQFGIGFGSVLSKGPRWDRAWEDKKEPGNIALLYNIGLYF